MMFIMHISILLAYSVLLASTVLLMWSLRNKGAGSGLGKTIGSIVFILSLLSMLCIGYSGLKYWANGYFDASSDMSMGMRKEMIQKMMPLMMQKMMENMGQMGDMQNKEQTKKSGNMYNMEHLQNMGSERSMEHMQTKEGVKGESAPQ